MSPRTERQHFVPAFYVAQWATPQERTGRLMVFDRTNGNSWPSTPDGVGFARDVYTVDARDAPQAVEDALAKLEGIGSAAINEVKTSGALPDGGALRPLLAFVALQAARTPRVRQNVSNFYSEAHLRVLDAYADHPKAFAKAMRELDPAMSETDTATAHSQLRDLLEAPGLRVEMDQTTRLTRQLTSRTYSAFGTGSCALRLSIGSS